MEPTAVEASVASVREQVHALVVSRRRRPGTAAGRVYVRRVDKPAPGWRITAKVEESHPRRTPNLSFSQQRVALGNKRIVVPEPAIVTIIGVDLKDGVLTLWLVEARLVEPEAERESDKADDLVRVSADVREKLNEPARKIAATRAFRALSKAIAHSPIEALADVASVPSDVEVAVRALQQPDAIEILEADDPLGPARLRGLRARERLLMVEGGTLSVDEVAAHLRITRQAVNKRRQQRTLVALDAGRHGYRYPAWQFVQEGTIRGLEPVLAALEEFGAWMQQSFIVNRNTRLGDRSPLEALRQGQVDDVLRAARTFGEHGAA